jgi:hypothetical protein
LTFLHWFFCSDSKRRQNDIPQGSFRRLLFRLLQKRKNIFRKIIWDFHPVLKSKKEFCQVLCGRAKSLTGAGGICCEYVGVFTAMTFMRAKPNDGRNYGLHEKKKALPLRKGIS